MKARSCQQRIDMGRFASGVYFYESRVIGEQAYVGTPTQKSCGDKCA